MKQTKFKTSALIVLILCYFYNSNAYTQPGSKYYTKENSWQETITNSIKKFHSEKERLTVLLNDEKTIKLGDWHSVNGFYGERDELHKKVFGPEKNNGLEQVYSEGQKWIARPEFKDGQLHHFDGEAREVTYLQRTIEISEVREFLAYISSDDGLHVWLNGKLILENDADRGLEPNQELVTLKLKKGINTIMLKINNLGGAQGYFFSLLPDEDVFISEIKKIWNMTARDFSDPKYIFQIEREQTDEIWKSQVKDYNESDLIENYLKKITRVPQISEFSNNYIKTVKNDVDINIIRELYYLTCKYDNILYLDDAHSEDEKEWNEYKNTFNEKAKEVASLITEKKSNEEKVSKAILELDQIFNNIPLRLPSGLNQNKFGAYYTSLKYDLDWDKHWRIGDHADIVVNFDQAGYKFVFWRGTSYIPCWVTETGVWYTNEFVERRGFHNPNTEGCVEPMSDKQCRYSHVRIIESNDARVVIHWRYAPIDVNYEHPFTDPVTGWSDWVDEVYTIYPSGIGVRKITVQTNRPDLWTEFQEAIVINQPGTMPEDNIELGAISVANINGESKTYYWTEEGGPEFEDLPKHASIMKVNLKAPHSPFALVKPSKEDGDLITSYLGHAPSSNFNFWDHWPVSQDASDGRTATSSERPSHSSLGHIGLPGMADVEWLPFKAEGIKRTKLMLHGMTEKTVEDLAPLAKSWLNAPLLKYDNKNFIYEGYDKTQAAYIFEDKNPGNDETLIITLFPKDDAPLINPAFIVKNWKGKYPKLMLNEKRLKAGIDFRFGLENSIDGTTLILWIENEFYKPIKLSLLSTND